ncbi:MAG: hypothetical protein WD733_13975 [Bryobacterales bacterium]
MQAMFWTGLVVVMLGITSLLVPIPRNEQDGLTVGGLSIDIETRHSDKVSPIVSAAMILGGAGLMIAMKQKR